MIEYDNWTGRGREEEGKGNKGFKKEGKAGSRDGCLTNVSNYGILECFVQCTIL